MAIYCAQKGFKKNQVWNNAVGKIMGILCDSWGSNPEM